MAKGKRASVPLKASVPANSNKKAVVAKAPAPAAKRSGKQVSQTKQVQKQEQPSETESSDDADEEDDADDDEEEDSEGDDGDDDEEEDSDDDEFEDQGSSSEDDNESDDDDEDALTEAERKTRKFTVDREKQIQQMRDDGSLKIASQLHIDDLSSDDEENINTIGNVPLRWYEDYDHIGYDIEGKKILKSNAGGDGIDNAIAAKDDPNYERTVYDAYNDRKIVVSDRDMEIIRRIQAGAFAHPEFEAYPEYVDYYTSDKMIHAMGNDQEPKSRFVPSKWERMKVMKIIKGIKEGRIVIDRQEEKKPEVYQLWFDDDQAQTRKGPAHVQAPKMPLPGHIESYNPPDEYLFTKEERRAWEEADPEDRETNFIPRKFKSLRDVCAYNGFVRERFERCLDLYLAPRVNKRKLNIDPESLVPELPKPRDLRPFPNTLALLFNGHTGRIRSITMDPLGQYLASGSDDMTVRIWEVETGRCLQTYNVGAVVHKVVWNPNRDHQLLAVAAAKKVFLIATGTGSADQTELTNALVGDADDSIATEVQGEQDDATVVVDEADATIEPEAMKKKLPVSWRFYSGTKDKHKNADKAPRPWLERRVGTGIRVVLHHTSDVKDIAWHYKGDYLSTMTPAAGASAVLIHQISKRKTQNPFSKSVGQVQAVLFHPSKPFFFHATQRHVRIYNLVKQAMVKKLSSGVKWISSMDVHPNGDHLIIGSYDRRLCWFDLDLSSTPYKTLKYHEKAVRSVAYHPKYPLMASASDDGTIHIFHAMVYSDLMKNPLIVPLKILRGHEVSGGLGVMSVAFHPVLPWVATGGADGTIRLFQNIH
ncbi:Ribosome biogenesis protein bop1-like, partial [Globisporangium splendens]